MLVETWPPPKARNIEGARCGCTGLAPAQKQGEVVFHRGLEHAGLDGLSRWRAGF